MWEHKGMISLLQLLKCPYYKYNGHSSSYHLFHDDECMLSLSLDFVVLVAAGNSGECLQSKSIGSPATAKSVISVGASMSNNEAYDTTGYKPPFYDNNREIFNQDDLAFFSSIGPTGMTSIHHISEEHTFIDFCFFYR